MSQFSNLLPDDEYAFIPGCDALAKLIRRYGVFALGGTDGCVCSHFEFRAVHVDISCHKSSGSARFHGTMLRVWSNYMGTTFIDLIPVAQAAAEQLRERSDVMVRFASYRDDSEEKCVYCGVKREHKDDYLCIKCQNGNDCWGKKIADQFFLPSGWNPIFDYDEEPA